MIDNTVSIISNSSLLPEEAIKSLDAIKKELLHTFNTVQVFRTETEMKYSVLQDIKFPTPDAKYWQAVREQNVMFVELTRLSYKYRRSNVELKMLYDKLDKESDPLKKELILIDIDEITFNNAEMIRVAKDRHREILQWSKIKSSLLPKLKHGDTDVDKHQFESYSIQFRKEAELVNNQTAISDRVNIVGKHRSINK